MAAGTVPLAASKASPGAHCATLLAEQVVLPWLVGISAVSRSPLAMDKEPSAFHSAVPVAATPFLIQTTLPQYVQPANDPLQSLDSQRLQLLERRITAAPASAPVSMPSLSSVSAPALPVSPPISSPSAALPTRTSSPAVVVPPAIVMEDAKPVEKHEEDEAPEAMSEEVNLI